MSMYYVPFKKTDSNGNKTNENTDAYNYVVKNTNASTVGATSDNKGATLANSSTNKWNAGTTTAQQYADSVKTYDSGNDDNSSYYETLEKLKAQQEAEEKAKEEAAENELADALSAWYQKSKADSDAYYDKVQKSSDLSYDQLRRELIASGRRNRAEAKTTAKKLGQNPSYSTGFDIDYGTNKNGISLTASKAENDANIAKGRYDDSTSLASNIMSSGLSNSILAKAIKGIM